MITSLSAALPRAEFVEHHSIVVDGPPAAVWAALQGLDWSDLRVTKPLVAVRGLGRRRVGSGRLLENGPVRTLATDEGRYVAGGRISQPWRLRPVTGPDLATLDELAAFIEPGWLKLGLEFRLHPLLDGRTRLETVTLCEPTDADARRRFTPYWRLIKPFSGLIRRDLLAAVSRAARRSAAASPGTARPRSSAR